MGACVQCFNAIFNFVGLIATAIALAAASSASGQAFNIDFGNNGTPPEGIGAAAQQYGLWNFNPFEFFIADIEGNITDLELSADFPIDQVNVSDNRDIPDLADYLLAGDGLHLPVPQQLATLTIHNLAPGTYDIYVYVWGGATPTDTSVSLPAGAPDVQSVSTLVGVDDKGVVAWPNLVPGYVFGFNYVVFTVEVDGNPVPITFEPVFPTAISGLQIVPLTEIVATADPGTTGDWQDPLVWDEWGVPDTNSERAIVDGDDQADTALTLDRPLTIGWVWLSEGDNVTCDTDGELAAPTILIDGDWALSDAFSALTQNAGLFADVFGGSGSVFSTTQWQNQIGAFTPDGQFTIAPTLAVVAPDGTQLFIVNDFLNFGQCTADGGEIDCSDIAIKNTGVCSATNNGLVGVNDCDVENTFGEFVATGNATCEFTNSTIVGGQLAAIDSGVICYDSSTCDDVTLTGENGGAHEFKGEAFWKNSTDPLGQAFLISHTEAQLPPGQATSVTIAGDVFVESALISMEFDPAGWGKEFRVNDNEATTLIGDNKSELRMADSSSHWIRGNGAWTMDIPIRGAGRIGLGESQITNLNEITADVVDQPLIVQPKDDGESPGFMNDGVLGAVFGGILELRPDTYDNTNGVIRADNGTVEFDGSMIFGGIIESLNGGEFRVTADSAITGPITIASNTPVIVEDERALSTAGEIDVLGEIEVQSDAGDGTGGVLLIGEDTTFSGPGFIIGEPSGNGRIDAIPNKPVIVTLNELLTISGALVIGQINGDLAVENDGQVIASETNEPLTIHGPTTNNNLLGSENGAQLELVGGAFFPIPVNQGVDGVINAGDGSTVLIQFVNLTGGELASDGSGTTMIEDSELLDVDSTGNVLVDGNLGMDSDLNNDGQFTLQDGTVVNLQPASWSLNGSGVFSGSSGSSVNGNVINNGPDQTITGGIVWQAAEFNNFGTLNPDGMSVSGPVSNAFDAVIEVGSIGFFAANGVNNNGGTVGGSGFISGPVNNNGSAVPGLVLGGPQLNGGGSTIGVFTVDGVYEQGVDGRLEIELAGSGGAPGIDHDQLTVEGGAILAGTLDLVPIDGFLPSVGNSFTVLTADQVIGQFDSVSCPNVFDVMYEADQVVVNVINPFVPADLDCSGAVNIGDLLELLAQWGDCPAEGDCTADLDGNGAVDVADLLMLLANWG